MRIPRTIWQTYREEPAAFPIRIAIESWKQFNPRYDYRFLTDSEIDRFMIANFNAETVEIFRAMPLGVMRADMWRYAVLYVHGGVYVDLDTECLAPIEEWLPPEANLVVGLENDLHFCQWAIAAAPGHAVFTHVLEMIKRRWRDGVRLEDEHFVHWHTGPAVWTNALLEYLQLDGQTPARACASASGESSGIRLLDETAFNGGYVRHLYGSRVWGRDNGYVSWIDERDRVSGMHRCRPRHVPGWRLSERDGAFYLEHDSNGTSLRCNESAAAVLRLCDGERSIQDLSDVLSGLLDAPPPDLVDQVREIVEAFLDMGVLADAWARTDEDARREPAPPGAAVLRAGPCEGHGKSIALPTPAFLGVTPRLLRPAGDIELQLDLDRSGGTLAISRRDGGRGWQQAPYVYLSRAGTSRYERQWESAEELTILPTEGLFPMDSLTVFDIGRKKRRYGNARDGGYVLSEEYDYDLLLSCGIDNDIGFEKDFLARHPGVRCVAFDGSVEALPEIHPRIEFQKRNIGSVSNRDTTDLREEIREHRHMMLKMDIEGGEFPWLLEMTGGELSHFRQIVMEIHYLSGPDQWQALEKVLETHYLVHVHGNNIAGSRTVSGLTSETLLIRVGPSRDNTRVIELGVRLPGTQGLHLLWSKFPDRFAAGVFPDGRALAVRRIDDGGGWGHDHYLCLTGSAEKEKIEIPQVMECTFVRKSDVPFTPPRNRIPLPGEHDAPNAPERPDIDLNRWPFVNG